jgi:hypothetical protein
MCSIACTAGAGSAFYAGDKHEQRAETCKQGTVTVHNFQEGNQSGQENHVWELKH